VLAQLQKMSEESATLQAELNAAKAKTAERQVGVWGCPVKNDS